MTARRNSPWLIVLLVLATFNACGPAENPTSPMQSVPPPDEAPLPESGPEMTTAAPAPMAASRIFETSGDPNCCTVTGGPYARFGFRLTSVSDGFHPLVESSGTGSCNNPPQDPDNGITLVRDGSSLSWTSTMPVGAIIVGSSVGARVYVYSPRSWGDSGLRAMVDPNTGSAAEIASLEICYDYALRVTVQVSPTWTRSVQWSIDQTVTPNAWELFPGDRAKSEVEVAVAPIATVDSPPRVLGTLTIENRTPLPATVSSITNIISVGIIVPVDCAAAFPFVLQPGASRVCSYSRELPDTSPRTNLVSVNTTSVVRGGSGSASIVFGPQTIENASVHVVGPDGNVRGPFAAASSFTIQCEFECSMLEGASERDFEQQTSIVETKQFAEQQVRVRCLRPELMHELSGSFRRTWQWSLQRTLAVDDVILASGQSMTIDGSVAATATAEASDFQAQGTITVHNPHAARTLVVTLLEAQLLSQAGVSLDCGFPMQVPASGTASCAFSMTTPDGSARASLVRLNYQNYELHPDGSATPTTVSVVEHTADLRFDNLSGEVDRCVELRDDLANLVSNQCVDAMPVSIPTPLQIGPYAGCGPFSLDGMAELIGLDSGSRTQSTYHVGVHVTCESGCTRGTGYWKSHAPAGPPPYDSTWEFLPQRGATLLFDSGMSYVEVLWASTRGSAWIQLAQPWIAAHLNQLAGADPSAVAAAFAEAEALLRGTGPAGPFTPSQALRMQQLGDLLESWNSGEIGPGPCPPLSTN